MKKYLSLFLALLTILALFTACGESTGGDESSTASAVIQVDPDESTADPYHDADGFLLDSLPELNFNGVEVGILYDTKGTNSTRIDFFAAESNGEPINDALYSRNIAVEERLGVTLKFTGETGNDGNQKVYMAKAQADAQADNEFTIYGAYSRTIPLLAYNGMCTNLLDTEYFDVEKPWWPDAITTECTIHDVLYFCTGDISTNTLWMMSCLYYNTEMMENQHLDQTPENIVFDGKWTLDMFCEICNNAYQEGADESSTVYGMSCYTACFDAFLNSCGVISIVKDGNGDLMLSDDYIGEKTVNIVEKLGSFCTTTKTVYHASSGYKENFANQQALFILDGTYIVAGENAASIDFEYGIMPLPKYNEEQETYVTNLRYPFNVFGINATSTKENKTIGSAILEALCSDSYRRVTPVQFESTMKTRYSKDNDASKIYDIIRNNIVFDLGRIHNYSINNYYPNFRNACFNGGTSWSSQITTVNKAMKKLLTNLTAVYTDYTG